MVNTNEMVELFQKWGYKRISGGCYGDVYGKHDGQWIVKSAANDGTRTYLEWVLLRTKQGRRMRGMPEIDFLVGNGDTSRRGRYFVGMKRYQDCAGRIEQGELGWVRGSNAGLLYQPGCPEYVSKLCAAFEGECNGLVNDLHHRNVLWDERKKSIIVTDPSSAPYAMVGSHIQPDVGWLKNDELKVYWPFV